MYAALLHRSGRQMREPYTLEHLAVTLTALSEGVHTRWAVDPSAVPEIRPPAAAADDDSRWTFFASVAYTTFLAMTEQTRPRRRTRSSAGRGTG